MAKNGPAPAAKTENTAPAKKTKEVIFYCFSTGNGLTGYNRLVNNFLINVADKYVRPDGKDDFRNEKTIEFPLGIFKTSDQETIDLLDKYIEDHPHGEFKISREEPVLGDDGTPKTQTVTVEKPIIPFAVVQHLPLEVLKEMLKTEFGFETESVVFDEIVTAAQEAGHISKE